MNRLGAMTVCRDEQTTIAFAIGSIIDHVDHYVVVDNGSTDNTKRIIQELFMDYIDAGILTVAEWPPEGDMGGARNIALNVLRKRGIDYFIKADADEVWYDRGITAFSYTVRCNPYIFRIAHTFKHELYQYKVEEDEPWLKAIMERDGHIFYDRDMTKPDSPRGPFGKDSAQPVQGGIAQGNWTDEAAGKPAEGIRYPAGSPGASGRVLELHATFPYDDQTPTYHLAHYGYARPMHKKRWKEEVWQGASSKPRNNLRVDKLHLSDEAPFLVPFTKHPEIFYRLGPRVLEGHYLEQSNGTHHPSFQR